MARIVENEIEIAGLRDVLHDRDLESQQTKKDPNVTVTALEDSINRPVYGRRKTTGSFRNNIAGQTEALVYEEEDALTKIGNLIWKIHSASVLTRYALYILPVAILLAIPLIVTATVKADTRIDGIRCVWQVSYLISSL